MQIAADVLAQAADVGGGSLVLVGVVSVLAGILILVVPRVLNDVVVIGVLWIGGHRDGVVLPLREEPADQHRASGGSVAVQVRAARDHPFGFRAPPGRAVLAKTPPQPPRDEHHLPIGFDRQEAPP